MENQDAAASSAPSLGSRIVNVFASPSEAFEGITSLPSKTSLWLIPWLVATGILAIFTYMMFSNEAIARQMQDMRMKAIDKQVQEGKMTREQADRGQEQMEKMEGAFKYFGMIGVTFVVAFTVFGWSLAYWLVGKFALKSPEGYVSYLGMYGVSAWIFVLGSIVTSLMILGMNSLYATPSLALLLPEYDMSNTTHRLLARIELFSIWQALVTGIGLAKVTGKPTGTGIGISIGLWALWSVVMSLLRFGM